MLKEVLQTEYEHTIEGVYRQRTLNSVRGRGGGQ